MAQNSMKYYKLLKCNKLRFLKEIYLLILSLFIRVLFSRKRCWHFEKKILLILLINKKQQSNYKRYNNDGYCQRWKRFQFDGFETERRTKKIKTRYLYLRINAVKSRMGNLSVINKPNDDCSFSMIIIIWI